MYLRALFFFIFLSTAISGCHWYGYLNDPNVKVQQDDPYLYIATGSNFDTVVAQLERRGILKNTKGFVWVAKQKSYPESIKPGRYKLIDGMTNNALVNLLKSGKQTPVQVSFHYVRSIPQLAGKIAKKLEVDSISLVQAMCNPDILTLRGLNEETCELLYIPNTYEFYWNTGADAFVKRMAKEYDAFWTEERKQKAATIPLTPAEVGILASIVMAEQSVHKSEWKRIAGLYINRLKKGMLLQSDPTVIFAHGNTSIKRVLHHHLEIDSPYNTYKYEGLPPGPIMIPEPDAIDAVLNYEKHNFLYMCAKEDFSGHHSFAVTLQEHNRNATRYQRALDKNGIK
ncbi:MAG: endolytic transglycosylase MltG [Flavobacteriales bacterium]|nr:endolytic transglycosylase MltG [Flavobacteriales bacterium]